ncbi:MAG: hypothetical protein IIA45_05355 [Bacteroidetes bacterium]|nr:hypothetical protein [Bacteroidota bacterium]
MKLTSIILLVLAVLLVGSSACKRDKVLIKGTWVEVPYDANNTERWFFDADSVNITNNNLDETYYYTIQNKLTKKLLYVESYLPLSVDRWTILKLNKDEFYIVAEFNGIQGANQKSFVKE